MRVTALVAWWSSLSRGLRRGVAGFALAVVAMPIVFSIVGHPSRSALFATPLRSDQVSEVQEQLAAWNVAFSPAPDNVYVESKRRNELLLRLSFAGLPHGHIGSSAETLATIGALSPQAVVDAQTRNGLAGDVALGLRGLDGIQDARVIIAAAKPGVFADEASHDASASVRLEMRPGFRLSNDAVRGIRSFVAASITGLDPSRVTILDQRGVALGESTSAREDSLDLQQSIQSVLDTAFGSGAVLARVRFSGHLSIAVLIDSGHNVDGLNVRSLVAAASGLQPSRGDTIEVATVPFAHPRPAKRDGWWLAYGAIVPLLPALLPVLALVLGLRSLGGPLSSVGAAVIRRMDLSRARSTVTGLPPSRVHGALRDEPPHAAAAIISALPAATAAAVLELYPPHERTAIVRRMSRPQSPLVPDPEAFIGHA